MFGQFLVQNQVISADVLAEALEVQRFRVRPLGRILRELGYVSQDELNRQLHLFLLPKTGVSLKKLGSDLKVNRLSGMLSQEATDWAAQNEWLLLREDREGLLFLAPWYRDDLLMIAESRFRRPCKLWVVSSQGLNLIRHLSGMDGEKPGLAAVEGVAGEPATMREGPYACLLRDVLERAQKEGASDIHIQPQRDHLQIRLRVNGDLETIKTLNLEHRRSFINEAKRLCGFSIAISGESQDGRVSLPTRRLDLRSSLIPTQFGEKIVLRLLDLSREFSLERSGLAEQVKSDLTEALQAKNGVIVVSGPTGSGKTTLLYTLLCALDRATRNVVTLEDPIEYSIAGLTQVQVTPKLSFANALRALLRQDPDVILVGEIRDTETADLCMKAASTGHLVLTTLHANSATEAVTRLLNLGVERYMLNSCLRFSAAQRLVKRLCPDCSLAAPTIARTRLARLHVESKVQIMEGLDLRVRNPGGCERCRQGSVGRIPVLEYLKAPDIQVYLGQGEAGRPSGGLRESALRMVEKGEVDVFEALELE